MAKVDSDQKYRVVINHEEQYSIQPADDDVPKGWKEVRVIRSKKVALDLIAEVWTDMRPLSLRWQMQDRPKRDG
ncbi:MAG: MbtH family NRPS accessory protein [Paracoccaceae bacterium]|nr:MbtH family NRPS accessory protein [Paracoccaceae bacterium]